jgi:hypothetical protein
VSFAVSCIIISLVCLIDTFYRNYSQGIAFFSDHYYSENSYGIINTHHDSWLFLNENLTRNYGFHPSYFSIYVIFSIFILLYVLFKNKNYSKLTIASFIFAIIYLMIFNFFLASRVGIISLFILVACSILLYFYNKKKLLAGIMVTLFFLFTISLLLQFFTPLKEKFKGLVSSSTESFQYSGGSGRFELWGSAMEVIKGDLLVGVGTGNLQPVLQKIHYLLLIH